VILALKNIAGLIFDEVVRCLCCAVVHRQQPRRSGNPGDRDDRIPSSGPGPKLLCC